MYVAEIYKTDLDSMFGNLNAIRQRAAVNILQALNNCYHVGITRGENCVLTFNETDTDQQVYITYANDPIDVHKYPIKAIRVTPDKNKADKDGHITLYDMWQDIEILVDFGNGSAEWNNDIYDTTADEMVYLLRAVLKNIESR